MILLGDTETTDLTKPSFSPREEQPRVLEIAMILVAPNGDIVETLDTRINPEMPLREWTKQRYGWKDEDFANKPKFADVVPQFRSMAMRAKTFGGHNSGFDKNVLTYELARVDNCAHHFPWPEETLDTVQEFKHLFGFPPNLEQLHQKVVGSPLESWHRAMADTMAVYRILKAIGYFGG